MGFHFFRNVIALLEQPISVILKTKKMKSIKFDPNKFKPDPKKGTIKKVASPLKRTPLKQKYKKTGEGGLFMEIWSKRPHVSFIDKTKLGDEAQTFFFAHVLPKGKFPEFRLVEKNIVLLTQDQHYQFDMCPRSEIAKDPLWKPLLDLEVELKSEYKKIK